MEEKPHGLKGRPSNARKPEDEKATSYIHARCKPEDKGAWIRDAKQKNMKLTDWIIEALSQRIK